jgi:exonuclease SbcC
MSKKVKAINIEAFRAYEEEMKFDFRHGDSDSVADLVVIYAPNGYGKTSFFDAVEWAVTNQIGRFTSSTAIKEEVKKEEGPILKNKNSEKSQGTVQIISEDDKIFEKKTKKITGKMKGDYKPGILGPVPSELSGLLDEQKKFCITNMLAHDKITNFLQTYTAGDKSDALKVFWDNNGYSEILTNINEMYKVIVNKEKDLSGKIKSSELDLKKYKMEKNKESEVIELINIFNSKSYEHKINEENLIENIDIVAKRVSSIIDNMRQNRIRNEQKISSLELLTVDYPGFNSGATKLKDKLAEKVTIEKKIKMISSIEKLNEKKDVLLKRDQEYKSVLNDWDTFNELNKNVVKYSAQKKKVIDARPEVQRDQVVVNSQIQSSKKNIADYLEQKKQSIEYRSNIDVDINNYSKNVELGNKYASLIKKSKYIIDERKNRRNSLVEKISAIELEKKSGENFKDIESFVSEELKKAYESYKKLIDEKSKLELVKKELEARYKKALEMNDKHNQLIIMGKELIEGTESCTCPLCHKKYDDYATLIRKMESEANNNEALEVSKTALDDNSKELKRINQKVIKVKEQLDFEINETIRQLEEKSSSESKKMRRLQVRVEDWKNLDEKVRTEIKRLKEKYSIKKLDISNNNEMNKLKGSVDKTLAELEVAIDIEENKLKANTKLEEQLQKRIKEDELKVIDFDEKINQLTSNNIYRENFEFLEVNQFDYLDTKLSDTLQNVVEKGRVISEEIKSYEKKIAELESLIDGSKDEVSVRYNEVLIQIQKLTASKDEYLLRVTKALEKGEYEEKDIKELLNLQTSLINQKIKENTQCTDILSAITDSLSVLQQQKIWLDKKKELTNLEQKLATLTNKLEKLNRSKEVVEEFIVDETNKYFDSTTINQIYNKIDPHPNMSHIKFITKNSSKGLQTHIYTFDDNEEDKMSPVLYLSSAQVNILSLCIFLAKVLTEDETTLNTIFMDDPIQHLDGINLLAFIDLLRTITTVMGRQIIISTHNEHFYDLIKVKMDDAYYCSKFIELKSVGEIK